MPYIEDNIARTKEKYLQPEEVEVFTRHIQRGLESFERKVISEYLAPDSRVLDVGCGAGREAFEIRKMGCRDITAIDVSPAMIQAAKAEDKKRKSGIKFIEAEAGDFIREDEGGYDIILLLTQLLCHIPGHKNRIDFLARLGGLLSENGVIILSAHNRHEGGKYRFRWKLLRLFTGIWRALGMTRLEFGDIMATQVSEADSDKTAYLHIFTMNEIIDEVRRSGLELISARSNTEIDEGREIPEKRERDRYVFYVVGKG